MRNELGSIVPHGDDAHRVFISAGYDKSGKRVRVSKVVRGSKTDSKRELRAQLMRSGKLSADKLTLSEFLTDVWLPTKEGRRLETVDGYACKIRTCIDPYIGHLPLQSVDAYVVERWMADMARDGKSPQTIILARSVLKNAMRAAVRWHHIGADPTDGTEKPRVTFRPHILSGEQMGTMLSAFEGHIIEPIVILHVAAGLRRSESCAIDWSSIDFEASTVTILNGLHEHKGVYLEDAKSETSHRVIGLPSWAMSRLRVLRAVGPLVPDGDGRMAPHKVSRLYKQHVLASGLPYVTLRELRNSHGTYLRSRGIAISDIADRLGHSDERVTKEHYIDRESLPVNTTTVAALEGLRVCQSVPDSQAKHAKNPQVPVDNSREPHAQAR